MGFVKAKARITNPDDRSNYAELELLADTGATFTLVPRELFACLGVQPDARFRLKMADGKLIERDSSTVLVETEGRSDRVRVIAGENGDVPVLGVTTLEILGLEVDPVSRKLKPTDYLMLQVLSGGRP